MLNRLSISNYALIDNLELNLGAGLTIITGETGAGKSVMLGALSMLLGSKADSKVVGDAQSKSIVEAVFTDVNPIVGEKLKDFDPDIDFETDELIVRREISPNGRSRAFINDTPVNIKVLAEITPMLIDIHSQHSNVLLQDSKSQLDMLDRYAGNQQLIREYQSAFRSYGKLRNRIVALKTNQAELKRDHEAIQHKLSILDKINPKRGELLKLEQTINILSDAGDIKENLTETINIISDPDCGILSAVETCRSILNKVDFKLLDAQSHSKEQTSDIPQRLNSIYVDLKDIVDTIERKATEIEANPEKLVAAEERFALLNDTRKRFGITDEDGLCDLHEELKAQLKDFESFSTDTHQLEAKLAEEGQRLRNIAERLSDARTKAAKRLADNIVEIARPLGLNNLRFVIDVEKGKLTAAGQDAVTFTCSFNKNRELMPLAKVASGGEMSRIMLVIKSIMSNVKDLPTLVLDEIDTGVSGEIADRMGNMMVAISERMQVIAITHLPQVAAKGKSHYKVYKTDSQHKTTTSIQLLDYEDRLTEIAKMLSGSEVNRIAIENARILMTTK